MLPLITGILVFFSAHLLPCFPQQREKLQLRLGENGYKGLFSLVSATGLGLIIYGKATAPYIHIYSEAPGLRHLTYLLVAIGIILVVISQVPCNLRRLIKHPMLLGVLLWACGHILINGDLASLLLFGSFLAYAVFDLISVFTRGAATYQGHSALWVDVAAIAIGIVLTGLLSFYHMALFGISAVAV